MFRNVAILILVLILPTQCTLGQVEQPHFASGIKIGEVTHDSAIIWVRLTKNPQAKFEQLKLRTEESDVKGNIVKSMPVNIVPGIAGSVRIKYWPIGILSSDHEVTKTKPVTEASDFTGQFQLSNLKPNSRYRFEVEGSTDTGESNSILGEFKTAPASDNSSEVRFIVSTCQAVRSLDAGTAGHIAYSKMLKAQPDFFVHTGDILYYDKLPLCKTAKQARSKWHLMFAFEKNRDFFRNTSCYFMKDDHDTLKNDCWPGQSYGQLTFDEGLAIFREQTPMGQKTYRTFRWGKNVQIWLTENRDFRSSNRVPDGPDKTILGAEQKQWLLETITESDATFKFVISPGPIVGPDKKGKADNHANAAFETEGQELRDFLSKQENLYVICGDRHWQYCSEDPQTGLLELGCGPINDQHSFGGTPGKVPKFHRYFSGTGGYLQISANDESATAEWVNVGGLTSDGKPAIRHRESFKKKSAAGNN